MRPKFFTLRNLALLALAGAIFGGLAYWGSLGFPLPGSGVPSTAGKLVFLSDRDGKPGLFLQDPALGQALRLTEDDGEPAEPAWTPDGQKVVFTARRGVVRQLCVLLAGAGQKVVALTNTSGTKEQPSVRAGERVIYLDGGRIVSIQTDATEPKALFPTPEGKRENPLIGKLFDEGGITLLAVSPDGKRMAAVIKREEEQVLAVFLEGVDLGEPAGHAASDAHHHGEEGAVVLIGSGKKILCQFLPDNSLVALFRGGQPYQQPLALSKPSPEQLEQMGDRLNLPALPGDIDNQNVMAKFDTELAISSQPMLLPVPADGIAVAPDGQKVAFWMSKPGNGAGLAVLDVGAGGQLQRFYDKPVDRASWSADSGQLAFASAGDIFVQTADGASAPRNLTQGKGKNREPVWSPAALKK